MFPDGLISGDGRLQPGDQLIEINGVDMTCASHAQVRYFDIFIIPPARRGGGMIFENMGKRANLNNKSQVFSYFIQKFINFLLKKFPPPFGRAEL